MRRLLGAAACAAALAACATPGQVRQVESQVQLLRAERARDDSARAAQLRVVLALQERLMDSLMSTRRALAAVKGDVANDLYDIQQQLVQLQELTGQSQQRLTELRAQLEARAEQLQAAPAPAAAAPGDTAGAPAAQPAAPSASPAQVYEASLQQLRRGSTATARAGFQELLRAYPNDALVPDALYFLGQSFGAEAPDSAAAYYRRVAKDWPKSNRAPAALYNLGLLAERRKDTAGAREAYQQVIKAYPRAEEAGLARDRLKSLGR